MVSQPDGWDKVRHLLAPGTITPAKPPAKVQLHWCATRFPQRKISAKLQLDDLYILRNCGSNTKLGAMVQVPLMQVCNLLYTISFTTDPCSFSHSDYKRKHSPLGPTEAHENLIFAPQKGNAGRWWAFWSDELSLLQISLIFSPVWKQCMVSKIHRKNLVCLVAVLKSNNIYLYCCNT